MSFNNEEHDNHIRASASQADQSQHSASPTRSDSLGKLAEALAKAQTEFKPVHKNTENPFFKSKYADLSNVIAATQPSLAKNNLALTQLPLVKVKEAGILTMLLHSSGEWMSNELLLPANQGAKFDAQTIGSAITYARRYAYQAMVGVAAEFDDDGNGASNGNGSKEAAQAVAQEKIAKFKENAAPPKSTIEEELRKSVEATQGKLPAVDDEILDKLKIERVMGLITKIQRLRMAKGQEYRTVDMIDHADAEMHFVCFANHKYPDGTSFFSLLDLTADRMKESKNARVAATFLCSRDQQGRKIQRPVNIGNISFDEAGIPVLDQATR